MEDRQITIREANTSINIGTLQVHEILLDHCGVNKISARWLVANGAKIE